MAVGIARVNDQGIVEANPRFCELTGYASDELAGAALGRVFADPESYARVSELVAAGAQKQGAVASQASLRRKNGAVMEVLLTAVNDSPVENGVTLLVTELVSLRGDDRELFWQNRELTAFHRISEVMLSEQSAEAIFDTIARETSGMTDFPMVAIELCDFDRSVMVYRGAHGIPLKEMPSPFEVPMDVSLSGQVAYSGEALVEYNIADCREYAAPILRMLGVQTFVCVPIKSGKRVIGTLSLSHSKPILVEPRVLKAAGSLANYLATLFDRLHAREAVSRSEAELATVYDRVPCVLCLFDEQLKVVRANLAAGEFTGNRGPQTHQLNVGDFLNCEVACSDKAGCGKGSRCAGCSLRRVLTNTLSTGRSLRQMKMSKTIVQHGRTEEVSWLVSTERIQLGHTVRVLMCLEDITKNIRADEQIRSQAALLDVTGDAIYVRNFSDAISYWNEGAHRLYGWTAAEAVGRNSNELVADLDQYEATRALHAVQSQDKWVGELKQRSRDGRELTVQSRWTLLREPDGKPKSILVVNTDITEKKRLESQVLRGQRLESIGTLASGLAHDLNNVLAPIMMAVQFIKDSTTDESMKTCCQTLETCSRRGADIIRQVLMFARGVEGNRILLNPKHLIQEMQRIASETFPRAIEITTNISRHPCMVTGDATQIQQVIMNLCVNARDAMPGGGTLTIGLNKVQLDDSTKRLHLKAQAGSYVVISVADTGTGIPPELLDKIFDPFFTTKPVGHGTGLGLPTVMGIAENHGGFVHLESQPGKGTTFYVYIPAARSESELDEGRPDAAATSRGNSELILVVDDEPAVRRLTSTILSLNGYRSVTAAEGREGVKLYEQHRQEIKLILSDLMMPHLDGPGMLREIRQQQPGLKCIIMTGLGEENRIAEAKAAGADVVLDKPFSAEQLLAQVKKLLG